MHAQSAVISGVITDAQTRVPLYGVQVSCGSLVVSSDSLGKFELRDTCRFPLQLIFQYTGYRLARLNLQSAEAAKQLRVRLFPDSVVLDAVTIEAEKENEFGIGRLHNVEGVTINAGKKSEVITPADLNANLAANSARQIFSKVAGINIFENDGAGIQMNIGGRGLNPNRVSNFNTRQNGYDISADALGYPESYYTPPAEAVERIEILRGAASLQYGTQFGGMINFVMKEGNAKKKLELVSRNTFGSFGFFSTFNSFGGQNKKLNYYVFHQYKRGDGWRPNSGFNSNISFAGLGWKPTEKFSVRAEYTFMHYLAQQPGGLTDAQYEKDPSQSTRSRNWFKVNWNLMAVKAEYKFSSLTQMQLNVFGLIASRGALGILHQIQYPDPYDLYLKGLYAADDPALQRNLLWDDYKNLGAELRFLHRYKLVKDHYSVFLCGARYYQGHTSRLQGNGNAGTGAEFYFLNKDNLENSSFSFPSLNNVVFTENIFQLSKKFSVTPGLRFENIYTAASGYYKEKYYDLAGNLIYENKVNDEKSLRRSFVIGGVGLLLKANKELETYANFSQNYRSVNFNDMRVVNPNLKVDPELKDEKGFTADAGLRWSKKNKVYFDLSVFIMQYNGRIGTILQQNNTRFRTNVSDSRNMGIEFFTEADLWKLLEKKESPHHLSVFANVSCIDARYINSKQNGFENNKVELVPAYIIRSGVNYKFRAVKFTFQNSYVSEQYSDASNAVYTLNAVAGVIPAYWVADVSAQYTWKFAQLSCGVNNVTNAVYFTRRADGYPGPGILPSDPLNFYCTLQLKW